MMVFDFSGPICDQGMKRYQWTYFLFLVFISRPSFCLTVFRGFLDRDFWIFLLVFLRQFVYKELSLLTIYSCFPILSTTNPTRNRLFSTCPFSLTFQTDPNKPNLFLLNCWRCYQYFSRFFQLPWMPFSILCKTLR